jgi:nucleotide-binding universal stress UspA family protein
LDADIDLLLALRFYLPGLGIMKTSLPHLVGSLSHDRSINLTGYSVRAFESSGDRSLFGELLRGPNIPCRLACPTNSLSGSSTITQEKEPAPVIFATDFDSVTSEAIRHAALLGKMMKAPLHCLHVLPGLLEAGAQSSLLPRIMTQALRYIYDEKVDPSGACVCAVTYGSEVSRAVIDYAREQQAQMIVLGILTPVRFHRQARALITIRIINDAPCPVLTIACSLDKAIAA